MVARDAIITFMDTYLEKERFHDSLPIGLMVEGREEVGRVATGVSASLDLFRLAADWKADMVVVHHGMFWDKSERVVRGHLKKRLKILLDRDITLAGYHLPLDAHPEIGNNILIARALGIEEPVPFGQYQGTLIGFRGPVGPISLKDLAARGEAFFGAKPVVIPGNRRQVTSAAVISGGAWDHVVEAARAGVDCFITGTADEPAYALAREEGIHVLAYGHYATERHGVRRLGEVLAEHFHLQVRFFDVDNPL